MEKQGFTRQNEDSFSTFMFVYRFDRRVRGKIVYNYQLGDLSQCNVRLPEGKKLRDLVVAPLVSKVVCNGMVFPPLSWVWLKKCMYLLCVLQRFCREYHGRPQLQTAHIPL